MAGGNPGLARGVARLGVIAAAAALLAAGVLAVSRSGPADAPEATPAFLVPLSSDIRGTNPGVNRDANTDTVMMHVVEGLVAYREDGTPGPLLAQSIDISPDGRAYTFR